MGSDNSCYTGIEYWVEWWSYRNRIIVTDVSTFSHSTQAILQVMVIVSFGFVLTKMGYFTMEKQKVYMIAMTTKRARLMCYCVVVVEIKHGVLHSLSTLFKHFICHLLWKATCLLAYTCILHLLCACIIYTCPCHLSFGATQFRISWLCNGVCHVL